MKEVTIDNILEILKEDIAGLTEDNRESTIEKIQSYLIKFSFLTKIPNILFVYGSLRKGEFNFKKIQETFGENSIIHLYPTRADYMTLYDLGDYPVMMKAKGTYHTFGELVYCTDEVVEVIKQMELEAGYLYDTCNIWIENNNNPSTKYRLISVPTYVAGPRLKDKIFLNPSTYPRITCGDWKKYLKSVEIEDTRTDLEKLQESYFGYCY